MALTDQGDKTARERAGWLVRARSEGHAETLRVIDDRLAYMRGRFRDVAIVRMEGHRAAVASDEEQH